MYQLNTVRTCLKVPEVGQWHCQTFGVSKTLSEGIVYLSANYDIKVHLVSHSIKTGSTGSLLFSSYF